MGAAAVLALAGATPLAAQSGYTVAPVASRTMSVQAGGSPLVVAISGAGVNRIDSASVRRAGTPAADVRASIGTTSFTEVRVSISAASSATPASNYELITWIGRTGTAVGTFQVVPPPPVPASLAVSPTGVVGGFPATATVTLDRPAPSAGTRVTLTASDSAASVPTSVTVPAGQTSAAVRVETTRTDQERTVEIRATASGVTRAASLTLRRYEAVVQSVTLSKTTAMPTETVTATVRLASAPPAGGAVVPLSARIATTITRLATVTTTRTVSPTIVSVPVSIPPSLTVAAGAREATFSIVVQTVTTAQQVTVTAGTAPYAASANLTVELYREPAYVALRVEGPDHVDEGGTGSYRAIAVYEDGRTVDVTAYAFSWSVDNGAGATIQAGLLRVPAPLAQTTRAVVKAVWGEPDGVTRGGSREVALRTWGVEIDGPSEVKESDFDNHLQSGAAHYRVMVREPDGTRTATAGGVWSYRQATTFTANMLPDGTFGVYGASMDTQTEIRLSYTRNGVTRSTVKPVLVRYLPGKLTGLRILDGPMEVDPGASAQLRAQAEFRGAADRVVSASWQLASAPAGSTVGATTGLFSAGQTAGLVDVKAGYQQDGIMKTATWRFSVVSSPAATVSYIEILPPQPNSIWPSHMWEGTTRQYQAQATFQDGHREIISAQWSVNANAVQIAASGLLTTIDINADVPVTVTARYATAGTAMSATNDVLVRANYPASCRFPEGTSSVRVAPGGTYQFRLEAHMADGSTLLTSDRPTWQAQGRWTNYDPNDPAFAQPPAVSISATGLLQVPLIPGTSGGAIIGKVIAQFATAGRSCTAEITYSVTR
jgi:hypothetical protein